VWKNITFVDHTNNGISIQNINKRLCLLSYSQQRERTRRGVNLIMGVCCGHEVSVVPSQSVKYKGENILRHTMHTKVEVKWLTPLQQQSKKRSQPIQLKQKKCFCCLSVAVQPQRQTDSRNIRTHPHDSMLRSESLREQRARQTSSLFSMGLRSTLDCSTVRPFDCYTVRPWVATGSCI